MMTNLNKDDLTFILNTMINKIYAVNEKVDYTLKRTDSLLEIIKMQTEQIRLLIERGKMN